MYFSELGITVYTDIVLLFENSPFIFHSIDEDGFLTYVSEKWLTFFGYTREEVIGKKSTFHLTEKSKKYAVSIVLPTFFNTGSCDFIQYVYKKKDGTFVDVLLSAIVIEEDGIKHSMAFLTDITDRVKEHRELEEHKNNLEELIKIRTRESDESMELYKTLARTSPVGIMRTGPNNECVYVNKKWTQLTGQPHKDAVGDGWLNAVHEDDRLMVEELWKVSSTKVKNWTEEFRLIHKNGKISWVLCSGNCVKYNHGYVISFTNITKRKIILGKLECIRESMKTDTIRSKANGR
jgi:PAS domain S-box-containing protein